MKISTSKGFTLIEIMVALLIIAVALGGAVKIMGQNSHNVSLLSQKTFAQWVGLNQLAKVKLEGKWLKTGESKGEVEMAQQKWLWVQKVIKTEIDDVNRLEVSVYPAISTVSIASAALSSSPSAIAIGFFAKP